jgi:shikimate dehydrogenase
MPGEPPASSSELGTEVRAELTNQMSDDLQGAEVAPRDRPTMYFIGVTTGGSSIVRLFPRWVEILGLDGAQLVGVDCAIHADSQVYRRVVAQIKEDPLALGALVTTHKLDLLQAARDLFDELDRYALLCNEVSNIAKRDGKLIGLAKDPITAGRTLEEMLEPGHWGGGAQVLCLGAGGTAVALAVYFLSRPDVADRPSRFIAVNHRRPPLDNLRSVVEQLPATVEVEYVLNEEGEANDRLMRTLPAGSLVVNATGMGKDRAGSPITDAAVFPEGGVAWELNYRGELAFLHQAAAQSKARGLSVHDGWRYFIHAWAEHVAEVFHLEITTPMFVRLADAAEAIRTA